MPKQAIRATERVKMAALISNQQDKFALSREIVRNMAQTILDALGCHDAELSVLIVDDEQIAELNRTYLDRSGPTNVIAFSMREGEFPDINRQLLGDVVISVETAQKEAALSDISMESRLSQLMVHGILHLVGYDHEQTEAQARRMEKKGRELELLIEPGLRDGPMEV
jgi:probable rRNA maturation factor